MLKKVIAIFICLVTSFMIGNAQIKSSRDSIKKYYELINTAELAILESSYQTALSNYLNANKYKWLNSDDLYNTAIVAYLVRDTSVSIHYLNSLAAHGLKKKDLEKRNWAAKVRNDELYRFVTKGYDSIYQESYKSSTMVGLGKRMEPFMAKDQSVRGFIFGKDGRPIAPASPNPNSKISDRENAIDMLSYIKEFGFPSFEQTGFYDTMKVMDQSGTYWFLWWHRCPDTMLIAASLKAVMEGQFYPEDYALSIDMCRKIGERRTYHCTPDSQYSDKQIQRIDLERKKIYLEPLKDYIKKLNYLKSNLDFRLTSNDAFNLYKLSQYDFNKN